MRTFRFVKGLPDAQERQHNRYVVKTHAANSSRWQNAAQSANAPRQRRGSRAVIQRHRATLSNANQGARFQQDPAHAQTAYAACVLHACTTLPLDGISVLPQAVTMSLLEQVYQLFMHEFVLNWGDPVEEAKKLMQFIIADPGLLHAFLFSQQTRNRALAQNSTALEKRQTFLCYARAVEKTNLRLSLPEEACSNASILCVLTLAVHGSVTGPSNESRPKQGPLGSLQNLHLYGGSIARVPLHQSALHYMIRSRGGIYKLPPAIAQMISLTDILSSSLGLTSPNEPFFGWSEVALQQALTDHWSENHALRQLGTGFKVLIGEDHLTLTSHLVFKRLGLYTMGIDDYLAARPQAHPIEGLAEQRNFVQYSLLSLRAELSKEKSLIVWLCTQAATIYSFLCVFPIRNAPFNRLAKAVKVCLSKHNLRQAWIDAPRLMTWITAMSAIASLGLPERRWYVATLERCLRRTRIETWRAFQKLMLDFLWFPETNDVDGEILWNEIENSVPFEANEDDMMPSGGLISVR